MELDGTPDAGYGPGASPKTSPKVKAANVVHTTNGAMLKWCNRRRVSRFISETNLLTDKGKGKVVPVL
jgi:hypothetical protein